MSKRITGDQIYNVFKNQFDIKFHGDTYEDEESLENMETVSELMESLLYDLEITYNQTKNRKEYSALKLKRRLYKILDTIKYYADDWEDE